MTIRTTSTISRVFKHTAMISLRAWYWGHDSSTHANTIIMPYYIRNPPAPHGVVGGGCLFSFGRYGDFTIKNVFRQCLG